MGKYGMKFVLFAVGLMLTALLAAGCGHNNAAIATASAATSAGTQAAPQPPSQQVGEQARANDAQQEAAARARAMKHL